MGDGSAGATAASQESARHLEVAHTLGEHAARLNGLETRVDREISEIRSLLHRIEGQRSAAAVVAPAPDPNIMLLAQGLNRLADQKHTPPPSDVERLAALIQPADKQRDSNKVALIISLLFNGGLFAWTLRAALFGG